MQKVTRTDKLVKSQNAHVFWCIVYFDITAKKPSMRVPENMCWEKKSAAHIHQKEDIPQQNEFFVFVITLLRDVSRQLLTMLFMQVINTRGEGLQS